MAPHPYSMTGGTLDPELRRRAQLNLLGFPGPAPVLPKPDDEFRILMIGGSTVALGNPPLPQLLESRFQDSGLKKVRCYNFGVQTSMLRGDISRWLFDAQKFMPNLVIFYGLGNDIILPFQGDHRPGFSFNFPLYENNPLYLLGTEKSDSKSWFFQFLYQSTTLRILFGEVLTEALLPIADNSTSWPSMEWTEEIHQQILEDLKTLDGVMSSENARALVVLQPLVYFKSTLTTQESFWNFPELGNHARELRQKLRDRFGLPMKKLELLDLSSAFDQYPEEAFVDGIHLNQKANEQMATLLHQAVARSTFQAQ